MAGLSIGQAKESATTLLSGLAEQDQASLISFSDDVTTIAGASTDELTAAISSLEAEGNTALYDATSAAAALAAEASGTRTAVILLSDGEEFGGASLATRDESLAEAAASGAVFYIIGVGDRIDRDYLSSLASSTGGRLYEALGPLEIPDVYRSLEELLRGQYILTLTSSGSPETQSRKIEVTVETAGLSASALRDYQSQRPPPAPPVVAVEPTVAPAPTSAPVLVTEGRAASTGASGSGRRVRREKPLTHRPSDPRRSRARWRSCDPGRPSEAPSLGARGRRSKHSPRIGTRRRRNGGPAGASHRPAWPADARRSGPGPCHGGSW